MCVRGAATVVLWMYLVFAKSGFLFNTVASTRYCWYADLLSFFVLTSPMSVPSSESAICFVLRKLPAIVLPDRCVCAIPVDLGFFHPLGETIFHPLGETMTIGRCIALSDWLATKSPHLWLKSSSEVKVWVQDIFRRPQSGDLISKLEVRMPDVAVDSHWA